jgi:hypothetical protein
VHAPTRRTVLATGAVLALAGCLPADESAPPPPDPDLVLRRRVAAEVRALVAAYVAATATFPALAARLGPLAAEHDAHVAALDPRPPSTRPSLPVPPEPATATATLDRLADLERSAGRRRTSQSLRAGSDLARLLASVGACNAVHAALLGRDDG